MLRELECPCRGRPRRHTYGYPPSILLSSAAPLNTSCCAPSIPSPLPGRTRRNPGRFRQKRGQKGDARNFAGEKISNISNLPSCAFPDSRA